MLTQTDYTVDTKLFQEACNSLPSNGMKTAINRPTGDFFYDSWVLKDEYKGTVWETLYNSLPATKGEARIIILDPARCYQSHADIDDRYHLNILGEECYLIDLVREQMHKLEQNGIWYEMDTSFIHTAANFGRRARVQLVVRKLLKKNKLKNPVPVTVVSQLDNLDDSRFIFDNRISAWLNEANKIGSITNFSYTPEKVTFDLESDRLEYLKVYLEPEFKVI
jgi:hypothetical protein